MSWARREDGFGMVELVIAIFVMSVGVIGLIGTMDMSRRLTSLSEMKEVASHLGEQAMEDLRTLDYNELALSSAPQASTDPRNPGYYVYPGTAGGTPTFRWNQKSDATAPHTEPLAIDAAKGKVASAATTWSDGRLSGKVYRYVTKVDDTQCDDTVVCPGSSDYKRVTVAVTVDNPGGPEKPILLSALVADPNAAPTGTVLNGSENPLESPSTQCLKDGVLVECVQSISGAVSTYYLYDTPATEPAREAIEGSHPTHPTVAPVGPCTGSGGSNCPVPDLMGSDPPSGGDVTPPLYNYSNEITGGTWPGGAVIRRDTTCDGTPTSTDNTKGHLWVTAPLAAPMNLSGSAGMSISTATFNGVSASVTLCVRFYNVPGSIGNLVSNPPEALGTDSYSQGSWPRTTDTVGFAMKFRDSSYTIPAGGRLGVRIWVAASSSADIAAIYDHPLNPAFVQINEES